ncbi:P27 family phage terminase small subunit [Pseudonocardia sp. WMMC193]|uniref:P27 family phage terminase small subunit n=1 Tax=Pseudonocardia sp. WMMC193 TaxID=2911965 RepID=UPI001F2C35D2|nr:P27 family phage terminase small subunit [Pseudonocardia sp. WMMC193]MCF7550985.1 P27 family phage terminase small subunit [Pseudonocardia sp. WMMC193]
MGARGKLKLPSHMSVVDGGQPDDGVRTVAEQTPLAEPEHPAGWDDSAEGAAELAALWEQYSGELHQAGLIARVDGMTLEMMLRHFLAARQASEALATGEVLVDDRDGGRKKNPAGAEFRQQSALMLEYAKQMGMTFAARQRIEVRNDDGEQGDLFAATGGG